MLITCLLFFTSGCAAVLVGAGAGAGVYTWVKGELGRAYPNTFKETQIAVFDSLAAFSITIDEKTETPSTLSLKASLPDGTPISIKISTKTYNLTEVFVRCGRVGYWDRDTAEQIHVAILKRL